MYNNCNCNDDYERIKKRIDEESKKYKQCYIQGPPGPKGEQGIKGDPGPATIRVGSTETVESSEPALVINTGTKEDVILDFKIPKGDKGDKGEQGIQGMQGPKGEDGPTTIEVGTTETGEPNTEAIVKNVGTNKNVILNFVIPKGVTGDNGDKIIIGKTETLDANAKAKVIDTLVGNVHTLDFYIPQGFDGINGAVGPKGETVKSEGIKVINTKTISPSTEAEVTDDFDGDTHYLTFSIPKGEKGDQGVAGERGERGIAGPVGPAGLQGEVGPTGPMCPAGTSSLDAFAFLYKDNGNSYSLTPNTPNQIDLGQTSQIKNVDTTFTNTIKIQNTGVYKIDYFFEAKDSANANVLLEVRKENITVNGTKITKEVNNQNYVSFTGSIITMLNKNDKIDLALSSTVSVTLTPNDDTSSYLSVIKIDN